MIYVYDRITGQFRKMIYPYFIEYMQHDSCILYVQDACGNFFTLTFPDRSRLVATMEQLRNTGTADARCDVELLTATTLGDREIEMKGIDDYEREDIGREIE